MQELHIRTPADLMVAMTAPAGLYARFVLYRATWINNGYIGGIAVRSITKIEREDCSGKRFILTAYAPFLNVNKQTEIFVDLS